MKRKKESLMTPVKMELEKVYQPLAVEKKENFSSRKISHSEEKTIEIFGSSVDVISNAPITCFQIHPEVMKTYREKDLDCLRFTIEKFGQQTPVKAIEQDGRYFIIDGVSRFKSVTQLKLPSLIYEVVEVDEDKIMEYRLLSNVKTKRTFTEMCFEVEYVLDIIGKSQGKKRDLMGFADFTNDSNYGEVGKDRYNLACAMLGIEMKSSTLRKAMKLFWSEFKPEGKSESGIIELLDNNRISIDKAHRLLLDFQRKKNEMKNTDKAKLSISQSILSDEQNLYQLFNKSSIQMDELSDNRIDLCIDSHPYWNLRQYRNQDEIKHGQEKTLKDYIYNFKRFNEEKFRKLKPGGVLATIIGETYHQGYQGVCSSAEMALKEIGFNILDVNIWVKSNQQYTAHPNRFVNSYERIIVAQKPGAETYFKDVCREGSVKELKVKPSSDRGFYIANPKTCITNVITTNTFNPKIFNEIDPDFRHDAPCQQSIYEIFIEAYSKPGETVVDSFVGSGTVGVGLKMGRKVIGYDVDPLSIEFCKKRFDMFLGQKQQENQVKIQQTLSLAA